MTGRQQWTVRDRRTGEIRYVQFRTRSDAEYVIERLAILGVESAPWLDAWPLRGED